MAQNNSRKETKMDRRNFLSQAVGVAGAAPITLGLVVGSDAGFTETNPAPISAVPTACNTSTASNSSGVGLGYESLSPDEAAFVEALVNVMCPADAWTPNGVDCGLAAFIDRQLAGGFGKGERLYMRGPWKQGKPQQGYQLPLTPEQFFKAGLAAADEASQKASGKAFADLAPNDADTFLHNLAADKIRDGQLSLASWFNELVYPLFVQACFADPIYGGNVGKVFWKMIGYPGLPATHTHDMIEFRGKPYPGAQDPKSITDFS
jgi:gluconate 2-dehydrogenase gamma chain